MAILMALMAIPATAFASTETVTAYVSTPVFIGTLWTAQVAGAMVVVVGIFALLIVGLRWVQGGVRGV